uniref:BEN domain-containing protein n=1 Tax=Anopheles farauti TaxID=69004 RepID=A0A182QDE8_9DIPT
MEFIYSQRGYPLLVLNSFLFRKNRVTTAGLRKRPQTLEKLGEGEKPMPKVWYTAKLTFIMNRRGTHNLHFGGYVYVPPRRKMKMRRDSFMYDLPYEMINNRKGGLNLHFRGYVYRRKMTFSQTTNWVCANPMTSRNDNAIGYAGPCAARCVTDTTTQTTADSILLQQGVWLEGLPYKHATDSRGNRMYLFGYSYRKAASFRSTVDWVCVRNDQPNRCLARLVQRMVDGALKLNRHKHNHEPEKDQEEEKLTRTPSYDHQHRQQDTTGVLEREGGQCSSFIIADTYAVNNAATADDEDPEENVAVFSTTMRGKEQLLYMGQPFVFEKLVLTTMGERKKIWRCNQWWNQKCRARVYTVDRVITPLNRYHTHKDIVKRKQRVVKRNNLGSDSLGVGDVKRIVTKAVTVTTIMELDTYPTPPSTGSQMELTRTPTVGQTEANSPAVVPTPDARNCATNKMPTNVKRKIINKVPLHAGSSVYIATKDLLDIYTSKPAIYTGRLIELMYGVDTLRNSCLDSSDKASPSLVPLDPTILESVITHVVHVFQQQKQSLTTAAGRSSIRRNPYVSMVDNEVKIIVADTGARQLIYKNFGYHRNVKQGNTEYWRCAMALRLKCKATIATRGSMMRVNDVEHNHIPMRRLLYGLGTNGKRKLKRVKEEFLLAMKPIFIAISAEKQLIRLRDKLYQKSRGRAYRSTWSCIEFGCPGEIILFELKGGQIRITSAHNDDCTSDYLKNRPAHLVELNESEITRLEQTLANEAFGWDNVAATSVLDFNSARYIVGVRGSRKLKIGNYSFTKNKECMDKTYWSCARAGMHRCKARVLTYTMKNGEQSYVVRNGSHNHPPF